MDFCENGDMYDFMSAINQQFASSGCKGLYQNDTPLLKSIFAQVINGLDGLHNLAGFGHMDIKLENLLISNQGHVKLCDFGFSYYSQAPVYKVLGTESYMAPEIHEARSTPCKGQLADFFSIGVLFFILAFGAPPFHNATKSDTYFRFLKMKQGSKDFFKFHPHTRTLYREGQIDESLMELLLALMTVDPNQRVNDCR